jgi:hypothetical protein
LLPAIAFQEEFKVDMHALHALAVRSETHRTQMNVSTHQPVSELTRLDHQSLFKTVEDALLATIHLKSQTQAEASVSTDQWHHALAASKDNHQMDTHARTAQLDKFRLQPIQNNAIPHNAQDNIRSDIQSMLTNVVLVSLAHGQHRCQMQAELHASTDLLLTAQAALQDNLMMDTHANNAQLVQ